MILVTGASGLLGQHLVHTITGEGHAVRVLIRNTSHVMFPPGIDIQEGDVLDIASLEPALRDIDTVVHAAARVSFNPRRRAEIYAVNVEGTRNVVNASLQQGVRNLIHISSVAALGRKQGSPISEADPWTGMFATDYAQSKYLAELEVFRGGEEGLTVSLVNPAVILSGQPLHRSSGSLLDYAWKERLFYTSGHLNYVDVRDVADGVMRLINLPKPGERFTLCGGNIPYADFFRAVAQRWNKRAPSIRIPGPAVYAFGLAEELRGLLTGREPQVTRQSAAMTVRDFRYDCSKAIQQLGVRFHALEDTLDWCCARYAQDVSRNK